MTKCEAAVVTGQIREPGIEDHIMLDEIALIMIMRDVSNVAQDWSVDDKADQERDAEALEAFGDEVAVASFRERVRSGDAGKKKHQGHEPGADQNDDERERLYVFEEDVVLLAPGVVGHAGVIEDQQRDRDPSEVIYVMYAVCFHACSPNSLGIF